MKHMFKFLGANVITDEAINHHVGYDKDGVRCSNVNVVISKSANGIISSWIDRERLKQPGIDTNSVLLRFLNDEVAKGWNPEQETYKRLDEFETMRLLGITE
jgi:hypothetical protein